MTNDKELDTGTSLLFFIFYRAFAPTLGEIESPSELMSEHKTLVEGNCRILARLGLAVPDSALAFGYNPTDRLEDIFLKRSLRPLRDSKKAFASIEDTDVLNSIFDAAVADEDQPYVCPLARVLLRVLGLVVYSQDGDAIPTRELRLLAAERREEERNQQLLKAIEAGVFPPKGVFKPIVSHN
jgi:hypothetical protein